jgi:uncharacterized protein
VRTETHESFVAIPPSDWDALGTGGQPFLSHRFLAGLERTRCIGPRAGWKPLVVALRDARGLAAAAPAFLKHHSYGEFVFDFAWAQAYSRVGLPYYPKLVIAAPFTPATGPRLLVRSDLSHAEIAPQLIEAIQRTATQHELSSVHVLFPSAADRDALAAAGWLTRRDCQFHWTNRGYRNFDDFLATFTAEKRKKARRERRRVEEAGIRYLTLRGSAMSDQDVADVWSLHRDTFLRHGHEPYLSLDFFRDAARQLGDRFLAKVARLDGRNIATAVFFRSDDTLYGRYWGAAGDFHSLHFETCYHQGIELCIEEGIARFEPGTQGEHKVSRGFEPALTFSGHYIVEPRFRAAIADYLEREARGVDEYAAAVQRHVPYKDRRAGELSATGADPDPQDAPGRPDPRS